MQAYFSFFFFFFPFEYALTTTIKYDSDKQVRKVKAWRRKEESQELWDALNGVNNAIFATLKDMRENGGSGAREEDRDAALQQLFLKARELLKQMGTLAGVEIEPQEQTELCTATTMLKNVIVCGVPGAGGNDAVFALYRGGDQTRAKIELFWKEWRERNGVRLCPMPLVGTPHGEPGLRVEIE